MICSLVTVDTALILLFFFSSSKKQLFSKSYLHSPNLSQLLGLGFSVQGGGSKDEGLGFRVQVLEKIYRGFGEKLGGGEGGGKWQNVGDKKCFLLMIESFCPNSRALLPTFRTNCPDGSHFAQMGSPFAQNTTPNPCSLLSSHTPHSRICTYIKHSQSHDSHPRTSLFMA